MPLSAEQKKHLEQNWQNIQMRTSDDAVRHESELLFNARAKHNAAAIPPAYGEAALYKLEKSVQDQLSWTLKELDAMDVLLDDETEKFLLKHFNVITSMMMPLHFPPGVTTMMNTSAHQREHAQARTRMNSQLQREVTSAFTSFKFRARPDRANPAVIINQIHNSPGARSYYQSTDNSSNDLQIASDAATFIAEISKENPELEALSERIQKAPDTKSKAEQITKWIAVVSGVETLAEKLHPALPMILRWLHQLTT